MWPLSCDLNSISNAAARLCGSKHWCFWSFIKWYNENDVNDGDSWRAALKKHKETVNAEGLCTWQSTREKEITIHFFKLFSSEQAETSGTQIHTSTFCRTETEGICMEEMQPKTPDKKNGQVTQLSMGGNGNWGAEKRRHVHWTMGPNLKYCSTDGLESDASKDTQK